LLEIVEKEGSVGVSCQFCNGHHSFDETDILSMFSDSANIPKSDLLH
jgi:molecular chaperone Hsp33